MAVPRSIIEGSKRLLQSVRLGLGLPWWSGNIRHEPCCGFYCACCCRKQTLHGSNRDARHISWVTPLYGPRVKFTECAYVECLYIPRRQTLDKRHEIVGFRESLRFGDQQRLERFLRCLLSMKRCPGAMFVFS